MVNEIELDENGIPIPVSVDLDGDPAWVHVGERGEMCPTQGSMVALTVAMTTGTCDMGETHGIVVTQNLEASEARKLAAALLNAADKLDALGESESAA